jgi:aryl-alcohol dehydrogenase-like predicted oxidoreductase
VKRRVSAQPPAAAAPTPLPLARGRTHPALGFGLGALGRWGPEFEARTQSALERAMHLRMEWFDTAEVYGGGRSERILGDALAARPEGAPPPFVTTKVSPEHLRPTQVRASLTGSLHRLGLSKVDLFLVHFPAKRPPIAETLRTMEALRTEGRVDHLGVANFSEEELDVAAREAPEVRLDVVQLRLSLVTRMESEPAVAYAQKAGILVEAHSALGKGLLSGRPIVPAKLGAEVRALARDPLGGEPLETIVGRAQALAALAKEEGVSLPSLAMHWLARRRIAVLFGASRPEQVDGILTAWGQRPDDRLLDRADALTR